MFQDKWVEALIVSYLGRMQYVMYVYAVCTRNREGTIWHIHTNAFEVGYDDDDDDK